MLLVSNHASYLDPICLGLASRRPIHFMAKEELFNYPILKQALPRFHAFSVRRGSSGRQALKTALERLKDGQVVGIFPQGTRIREDDLGIGRQGTALLALKSGAEVLPAAIKGSSLVMPGGGRLPRFPRLTVTFGAPIKFDEKHGERRQVLTETTNAIMKAIDELRRGA